MTHLNSTVLVITKTLASMVCMLTTNNKLAACRGGQKKNVCKVVGKTHLDHLKQTRGVMDKKGKELVKSAWMIPPTTKEANVSVKSSKPGLQPKKLQMKKGLTGFPLMKSCVQPQMRTNGPVVVCSTNVGSQPSTSHVGLGDKLSLRVTREMASLIVAYVIA